MTGFGDYAFFQCTSLTGAEVPDGVTGIGNYAFSRCDALTNVSLPESLTSLGEYVFEDCGKLASVTIPGSLTDVPRGTFSNCVSLTSANIAEGVENIAWFSFSGCTGLTSVHIPKSAKYVSADAFSGCGALRDVYYPGTWKQCKTAGIGEGNEPLKEATFHLGSGELAGYCGDNVTWMLEQDGTLSISGSGDMADYTADSAAPWQVDRERIIKAVVHSGVTGIGNCAFLDCGSLTAVNLPLSVTEIGQNAFSGCGALQDVHYAGTRENWEKIQIESGNERLQAAQLHGSEITWELSEAGVLTVSGTGTMEDYSFDFPAPWYESRGSIISVVIESGVKNIGSCAFSGCGSLAGVKIADSVTAIGEEAFYNCGSLTDIRIPEGVTAIGEKAFCFCKELVRVSLPESLTRIGEYAFSSCKKLTEIAIPEGVKCIEPGTFSDCVRLAGIRIPESVTEIGGKGSYVTSGAFAGCVGLKSIDLPESVTHIGEYAFAACKGLTDVTIRGAARMEREAFRDCTGLTGVTMENITSIGYAAFENCVSLKTVTVPGTVGSVAWKAFYGCSGLTGVILREGVKSVGELAFWGCTSLTGIRIPETLTDIGDSAFSGCTNLAGVNIPGQDVRIGAYAFLECGSLVSVSFPGSVKSVGYGAFDSCGSLKGVAISDGITSIPGMTFSDCKSLASITIPKTVTSIEDYAFQNCKNLKKVYYGGSEADWAQIQLGDGNSALIAAKRYCNAAKVTTEIRPADVESLPFGTKLTLTAWAMPEETKVSARWSLAPGDEDYAAITTAGVLTAKAVDAIQEITVIASPLDGSPEATKTIRILPQAKEITLFVDGVSAPNVLRPDIYDCTTLDFYAEVQPEGARKDVTWSSNNPKVASVAADGTVTLLKPGTAVIKATAADGSKVSAQVTLNVVYTDHSPKLGAAALNLNTASSLGTTVEFVEQLGNQVEIVSLDDDRFDVSYGDNRLTLKAQEPGLKGTYKLILEAVCADGRTYTYPLTVKASATLPKLAVKQTQKFNLFYRDSEAALAITGGTVKDVELAGTDDFVLENKEGPWVIRYADPENAPAKPNPKAILSVTFDGYSMPVTKALAIATVNTAPKLTLNPTSSILNTTLVDDLAVETALLGAEWDNLQAWTDTQGVDVSLTDGVLSISLSEPKTVTAGIYVQDDNWTKPVKLTHKITVTDKKPAVKLSAKGKLDVLDPDSEIVYTPKLTNATGTIEDVQLEGPDADSFDAKVDENGIIHLKLAKSGENYSTKKTYKVTPKVTLYGKEIPCSPVSLKVTQSAVKLAKIPNQTVYQSQTAPLTVQLAVTSPASAEIGDVQLNPKTTAALRTALETTDGIDFDANTVTFPALAFATLKPGKYTVILDVTPSNAASDTKPAQAKFTLTVQK